MFIKKNKKSQADIIVNVLLILIGIAAVSIVSYFIMGFVRNNLTNTDCLNTVGQIRINLESNTTNYNSVTKNLTVSVERIGDKAFNLTDINFIFGTSQSTKTLNYKSNLNKVYYYDLSTGTWKKDKVELPESSGEIITYILDLSSSGFAEINVLSIAPIINIDQKCGEADNKPIKTI